MPEPSPPSAVWVTASELLSRFDGLAVSELPGGLRLVQASTRRARRRGLGGLKDLPADQGLEIATTAIHTFTMHFPLDLIWRARDGRVVRVDRAVPRGRIRTCLRARSVIEVATGAADGFLAGLKMAAERG
ncbi:MAG TPA: DUF192 domain-containing protein [Solirubrobacteraceae bacterium]|nr:DUF192 domain-containing protein [Solirubrobacteraceae bacterium]